MRMKTPTVRFHQQAEGRLVPAARSGEQLWL
jgi:hypothetical protein